MSGEVLYTMDQMREYAWSYYKAHAQADVQAAARYQWLRDCARSVDWTEIHPSSSWSTVTSSHCRIDAVGMDEAIDAAIKRAREAKS